MIKEEGYKRIIALIKHFVLKRQRETTAAILEIREEVYLDVAKEISEFEMGF